MKLRLLAVISLFAASLSVTPANAIESRVVTGVSAFYRVDLGYMVTWQNPTDRSQIASYTVTANPGGRTCVARGANSTTCTFSNQQLGFKDTYTFTVTVNAQTNGPASEPSNPIRHWSIPWAPLSGATKVVSDTQIDVTWVPSPETGGLPLYGYRVTIWPSSPGGDPVSAEGKTIIATKTTASLTGLKPSTWYIINIQSCNASGCNSMDSWLWAATTPTTTAVTNFRKPRFISGGSADTTCFNAYWDGGTAASTGSTFTKSTGCPVRTVDASKYPVIDPTATKEPRPVLATKFPQRAGFGSFNRSYSMKEWSQTMGFAWFAYFMTTTKSPTLGFTTAVTIESTTPSVCIVQDKFIRFVAPGTCSLRGSAAGDDSFLPSNVATASFPIVA